MHYVFFDIECACVFKNVAKICAFGYVISDENFNVLEKEDILINPKGKFHLTDRKGGQGLVLPYEYGDFKQYPVFPEVYGRIKKILEGRDKIVLGHATRNDVNYLLLETMRYKLPSFRFAYHDTQFFYMNYSGAFSRQIGLQTMAEELGVEFTPHRAADDAYATMRVCEALCKKEQTNVKGICEKYAVTAGKIENYQFTTPDSAPYRRYIREREAEREARADAHDKFFRFVNKNMRKRRRGGSLEGKTFCFAREIEENFDLSTKLLTAIFAAGGTYTSHPGECNVYIGVDENGPRVKNALSAGAAYLALHSLEEAIDL